MRDYEPYYTEDGSIGLYSFAEKDVYHSKFGALTEAWEKFILPSGIDKNFNSEIKVLDVCYGIGYNTKALMSFFINKNKIYKKNILQKIFSKFINIASKYTNKYNVKRHETLSSHIESLDEHNNQTLKIDCLEINKEIVELSPLFRTIKTPEEVYTDFVPQILDCFDTYYKLKDFFTDFMSKFLPKNKKEINELLDIKFRNMHIEKEYKVNPFVNYIILNTLAEKFGVDYPDENLKKILTDKENKKFFDKSLIKYAQFNQKWGYNKSYTSFLSTFLHNIYYDHLSKRNKKMDFKTIESLVTLNFWINDARKTILELNEQYDYIFLDAFTYTKAPQLWSMEFVAELYNKLAPDGVLMTYSNSVQVRNTLLENNFYVGKIYNEKSKKFIGTIASKNKNKIKYPLNNYELGLCLTKAGIPYHDPNLSFDSKDILELREYEYKHSTLMSSSKYIKLRGSENE
mgnify:FL=1